MTSSSSDPIQQIGNGVSSALSNPLVDAAALGTAAFATGGAGLFGDAATTAAADTAGAATAGADAAGAGAAGMGAYDAGLAASPYAGADAYATGAAAAGGGMAGYDAGLNSSAYGATTPYGPAGAEATAPVASASDPYASPGQASGQGSQLGPTTPTAPATDQTSLMSKIQGYLNPIGSAAKGALPYASLGLNAYNLKNSLDATKALQGSAQQTGNVGSQLLSNYQSGQLSGADQQAIVQYQQQQTAAVNDYYAKAGLSNSSMHTQALQQVQQQAETMRQQALNNMLTQGLSATGTTNQALTAAAQAGLASSKDTSQAMGDFMTALSKMNATPGQ